MTTDPRKLAHVLFAGRHRLPFGVRAAFLDRGSHRLVPAAAATATSRGPWWWWGCRFAAVVAAASAVFVGVSNDENADGADDQ